MSIRSEKVSSVIKRVVVGPIDDLAREYRAGLVTVTSVIVTKDLSIAKLYLSIYGGSECTPGEFITILEKNKGSIRSAIGRNVKLRITPEVRFYLDDTLDQIHHIQNLLKTIPPPANNLDS